jgi:alcohol dehydrogenase
MLAREAWRLLDGSLEAFLADSKDLRAAGDTLLGAHLAGAAIEASMLGAAHSCANPLTAHYGIVHGVAVGVMLPHVVRYNAKAVGAAYDELDARLADRLVALRAAAGLPVSLEELGVEADRLPELAGEAARQWTAKFNPRPVTAADLLDLYKAAYEG